MAAASLAAASSAAVLSAELLESASELALPFAFELSPVSPEGCCEPSACSALSSASVPLVSPEVTEAAEALCVASRPSAIAAAGNELVTSATVVIARTIALLIFLMAISSCSGTVRAPPRAAISSSASDSTMPARPQRRARPTPRGAHLAHARRGGCLARCADHVCVTTHGIREHLKRRPDGPGQRTGRRDAYRCPGVGDVSYGWHLLTLKLGDGNGMLALFVQPSNGDGPMSEAMDMASSPRKVWLTPAEQIAHLKSKGVRFELISELDSVRYLAKNNNYFRLRSYRTGFAKVEEGRRAGEYAKLDFEMLKDLSIIDMRLRYVMLPMTLDVEHFAKVNLLGKIEASGEDGYAVVSDFLAKYDRPGKGGEVGNMVKDEIARGESSPYVASLVAKYPDFEYPAWAFLEVIAFGTFAYFYKFCAERFCDRDMLDDFYLLQSVKGMRNACAHNNCVINDMTAGKPRHKARFAVTKALGKVAGIGADQRKSKMSNERFQQIVTTLYMHKRLASAGVHEHTCVALDNFVRRMNRNLDYYAGNLQVISGFEFLTKVICDWFPVETGDAGLEAPSVSS